MRSYVLLPLAAALLIACGSGRSAGSRPGAPVTSPPPPSGGAVCGRLDSEPVVPAKWQFSTNMPNPHCDQLATTWANVPHADRVCAEDADCRLLTGDGNCWSGALNQRAAARPEYAEGPCGNPASGACAGPIGTARCVQGCCQVQ